MTDMELYQYKDRFIGISEMAALGWVYGKYHMEKNIIAKWKIKFK
jgi:hypothetical protein